MQVQGERGKDSETNLLCFNPQCPFPTNRFLSSSDKHFQYPSCKKWFHKIDDLMKHDKSLLSDIRTRKAGVCIDFCGSPIEALKNIVTLSKLNWKLAVKVMFQEVRLEMIDELEKSEKQVLSEVEKHIKNSVLYDNLIKIVAHGNSEESTSKDISDLIERYKIPNESLMMFNYRLVDSAIHELKEVVERLNSKLCSMEVAVEESLPESSQSQKTDVQDQLKKFEDWIGEEIENPFSKVQVLAASFSVIPSTYTTDAKHVALECFLCRQSLTVRSDNNKKNAKKQVTKLLLQHLMTQHHKEVFLNYRKKISKSVVREYSMDQLVEEIKQMSIKKVEIIDRENAGTYTAEQNGQFIFEVVSQRNASLARGNYVIAKSIAKDAADIVMSFMIKELFNIKNMSVRLVTNDHFGTTIEEICGYLGYDFKVISRLKR